MSVAAVRRVVSRLAPDRPPTDAELVPAIVPAGANREAAFAVLVERYGPMVLGVCRRVLADAHSAEDAFQAVFLVLARKAHTIRPPGAVGGWLHGVAVRTARKAKTAAARRRRREMAAVTANLGREVGGGEAIGELQRAELRAVIDDELAALPESQRAAVVLCDLHGKTRAEAAAELGRPEGTVAAWLARGRKALAARLARRGVALPAAGLVSVATPSAVSAELTSAAFAAILGRAVSPTALAIAESVMRTLSSGTTKLAATLVAAGVLLAAVTTAGAWYGGAPEPAVPVFLAAPAAADVPPAKPESGAWKETRALDLTGWLGGSVCFSRDGQTLFVGGTGGHVRAYETATLKPFWETTGGEHFAAVAVSPDGQTLTVTVKDGARFLDAVTGKRGDLLEEKGSAPYAVAWFPDKPVFDPNTGQRLATSRQVIFSTGTGNVVKTWAKWPLVSTITANTVGAGKKADDEYAVPLAVAPDGERVVVTGPIDGGTGKNVLWAWSAGSGAGNKRLEGHKVPVVSAAWAKDGKRIVTGDAEGVVITWDAETFKEKSRLKLGGRVAALTIAPDGGSVAAAVARPQENKGRAGAYTEEVFVWPAANPPEKPEPISRHEADGPFEGLASIGFAPDGKTLASGFANFAHLARGGQPVGRVRVFAPGAPGVNPKPTAKPITDVSYGPDGEWYLAVRGDKVEVYDAATGKQRYAVAAEAARLIDGVTVTTLGPKEIVSISHFDLKTAEITTHPRPKTKTDWNSATFSPDGRRFAAHFRSHVRIYDVATGFEPVRLDDQFEQAGGRLDGAVEALAFSANGEKLLACGVKLTESGRVGVAVWDVSTGKRLHAFPTDPKDPMQAAVFAPKGDEIAIGYRDRVEVRALGGAKKDPVRTFPTAGAVTALAYSKDGKRIAVGVAQPIGNGAGRPGDEQKAAVQVFDAATGKEVKRLDGFERAKGSMLPVSALAFNPDGKTLLAGTGHRFAEPRGGEVKVFALDEPPRVPEPEPVGRRTDSTVLTDHGRLVNGVAVAPDGKSFAAATDGNVTCWDFATRKKLWVYQMKEKAFALAYSPDNGHLTVAAEKGVIRLDAKTGKVDPWDDAPSFGPATAVAYSPEGSWLALADGWRALVYPAAGGKREIGVSVRETGDGPVLPCAVAWSPDGKRLAVPQQSDKDGWRVRVAPIKPAPGASELLLAHRATITAVAWSKDGKVIASGDAGGSIIMWDAATGKELWERKFIGRDGTAGRVNALAISPADGTVAVAVSLGSGKGPERVALLAGKNGTEFLHLILSETLPVTSVVWSGDGKYLVGGCGALPGEKVPPGEPAVGAVVVWERKPER
ncbi:MAG: sigma-70 family RNA polymerase sigma factor [Planctomycetes bacterium]|nr:sigma-70 family RNA polymerase sigma factor [Planctomycetota bacterium]